MLKSLILSGMLAGAVAAATPASAADERRYCTQKGPFMLRIDGDAAAGFYAVPNRGGLGVVVGAMSEDVFVGRWFEDESSGDIRIVFSDDGSRFDASYSIAPTLDEWNEGWIGYLPPAGGGKAFLVEDETYLCD